MNATDVEGLLTNANNLDWDEVSELDGTEELLGLGWVRVIARNEPGHPVRWFILEVHGMTYKKSGFYASHSGTVWDGPFHEVQGKPRVVTVWEPIGS